MDSHQGNQQVVAANQKPRQGPPLCPVCGTECNPTPSSHYTAEAAATHFCPPSRDAERYRRMVDCITRLWQGAASDVYHCPNCGFGFGHPFVGGDEEFYGILHEQHGYPAWRWDYDYALNHAVPKENGGRILDIGAGTGAFLQSLSPQWEKYAVEGSPTTRAKLKAAGIQVYADLKTLAQELPGSFRVVTMFQVLEHISSFSDVLRHCQQLLVPGGRLVISVPDAVAMQRQEKLTGCADMPPNHINKWTPRSLQLALGQAGLTGGSATYEAASWASFRNALYLRILANRADPASLAAKVYRIPGKAVRIPFIALLAVPAFFQLLPHLGEICRGGAFAMVGTKE